MTAHVVEVNECKVFATRRGAEWWTAFRGVHDQAARIADVAVSIGGNRCEVACDDKKHAEWLAAHMVEHGGLPETAVRVKAAAQLSADGRRD